MAISDDLAVNDGQHPIGGGDRLGSVSDHHACDLQARQGVEHTTLVVGIQMSRTFIHQEKVGAGQIVHQIRRRTLDSARSPVGDIRDAFESMAMDCRMLAAKAAAIDTIAYGCGSLKSFLDQGPVGPLSAFKSMSAPDPKQTFQGPCGLGAKSRALSLGRTVVSGGMDRSPNRHGILAGLFALFVAIFVLVPTVDAVACAVELEPAHAAVYVDSDGDDQPTDADGHAICSHGHCHHGGTTLPSSPQPLRVNTPIAASPSRPSSDAMKSRIPSGPKRPPRA